MNKTIESIYNDLNHIETLVQKEHQVSEVLEFINAAKQKLDDLDDDMDELKMDLKNSENKVEELEEKIEKLEDVDEEPDYANTFHGIEDIHWQADNLLDQHVMEAVEAAFGKYTHTQILEKLK